MLFNWLENGLCYLAFMIGNSLALLWGQLNCRFGTGH